MITVFAVGCAVAAALAINYALFMQKRVVEVLPTIEMRLSWTTFKAFLTNTTWLLSITVTLVGGAFYAVAIAIAPISVVQPVVSSGVAFLAYLAINNLGEKPRKVDLYAIAGTILGVILIGVSLAEGIPESVKHDPVELWLFAGFVVLVAVLVPLIMKNTTGNRKAASLGIAAGLLFGVAAIMARLLLVDWTNQWSLRGAGVLFSSIFLVVWALALLPGFITVQAALQRGMAVVVVPIVAGLAQLIPITGGMIALNEPFPENGFLASIRILAFLLILVATVILSRRAEETTSEPVVGDAGLDPESAW